MTKERKNEAIWNIFRESGVLMAVCGDMTSQDENELYDEIASAVEARDDYWMNQKANEHDNAIREAERKRISEAVKEMKSSVEKAGIKKQWEVTDEDRSSGSYNYIESGFLGGYQTAKQDILSIINPSKE